MPTAEIVFDAEEFVSSVEAFAAHASGKRKLTLLRRHKTLPLPIKTTTAIAHRVRKTKP